MIDLMGFNNFEEFYSRRKNLRVYYILLTTDEKRKYKKYIYSLNYKDNILDIIWEYFNEPKRACDYVWDYQITNLFKMYERNNMVFNKWK